jgi:hypothetical protein
MELAVSFWWGRLLQRHSYNLLKAMCCIHYCNFVFQEECCVVQRLRWPYHFHYERMRYRQWNSLDMQANIYLTTVSHPRGFSYSRARHFRRVRKIAKSNYLLRHGFSSTRVEQYGSHWTDFNENWWLSVPRKSVDRIQVPLKSDKNLGYFTRTPIYTYMVYHISLSCYWKILGRKM